MDSNMGIYIIISPTAKVYIGQSVEINKRLKTYENTECKNQIKISRSIKKYGFENHLFEVIELCSPDKLNDRERYWQDEYDVLGPFGLNCKLTKTSDKSGRHSDETKSKIRLKALGRIQTTETKNKKIISLKKKLLEKGVWHSKEGKEVLKRNFSGNNNPSKREEVKDKIRQVQTGRIKTKAEIQKNIATRRKNGTIFKTEEVRERIAQTNRLTKNLDRVCCLCCKKTFNVNDSHLT